MADLTKEISDTLCTVIATGFMKTMPKLNYIYDKDADAAQHEQLQVILDGLNIRVKFVKQELGKSKFPFIVAQTEYAPDGVLKGIVDELLRLADNAERKIEEMHSAVPLRGAYIGGMDDLNKVEFIGPSDLYLYSPKNRIETDGVGAAYDTAKNVSNIVIEFLKGELPFSVSGRLARVSPTHPPVLIEERYSDGKLFGSVHGMTNSIIHYSASSDKQHVSLELALGKDTCKVASCLPCSLFMWSNKTPATATHLGRGDNWNFPKGTDKNAAYMKKWREDVIALYRVGSGIIEGNPKKSDLNSYLQTAHMTENNVPDLFLEALTHESSFIDKMINTLS